jgi:DNA mismatch repair ATPase MutS
MYQDFNLFLIELDVILGDCSVAILQMETSIMICVTETLLSHSDLILRVGSLVSEIDWQVFTLKMSLLIYNNYCSSLMSISAVARSQNFTRPEIVTGSKKLAIVNGRHPLVVDCDFVTNTTRLEGERIFETGTD